ncbi:MAG: HNH endonuclease [Phycisphaeraceae bacterium]|nr:HNH endonuclease [Phycisphaeraceae bacterium]
MNDFRHVLALDIGSNSVGSAWIDTSNMDILAGVSIFPAGVEESDDKRGDPKNAKRRMTRRTRITLARRASRKRALRLALIGAGLLPPTESEFTDLLETTDPWDLRRRSLEEPLQPYEFGRVLLHLAQRRGALGINFPEDSKDQSDPTEGDAPKSPKPGAAAPAKDEGDEGKVKAAIGKARAAMIAAKARTFGEFMCALRAQRAHTATPPSPGARPVTWHSPIRNKAASYEFAADREMIRAEFTTIWNAQKRHKGPLAALLTDDLRKLLDDDAVDSLWRHKGLLFQQRWTTWDHGTLGRCVLEPSDRCVPIADMHAGYYRVLETVNNIRIDEFGHEPRPLTQDEHAAVVALLRGPFDAAPAPASAKPSKRKAAAEPKPKKPSKPKSSFSVTDIRQALGLGKATAATTTRLNIEKDPDREINTDWFHREIAHGAFGLAAWEALPAAKRDDVNRQLLRKDPEDPRHRARIEQIAREHWGLSEEAAARLLAAWSKRPKLEKRLSMSRRAVRNLIAVMERPWPVADAPGKHTWYTQIQARKHIAEDASFADVTTGRPFDRQARERYALAAKGLTHADRHYMKRHPGSLPPAPQLTNPVVRKAIHEVRRHVMEYLRVKGHKPDAIVIELAREAKMGAVQADRTLMRNRLRQRIRKDIIESLSLSSLPISQQRVAVERVLLCVQQGGICPLCGNQSQQHRLTPRAAADGTECELAHITPRATGGSNALTNLVLAHTRCNREMGRRTPRQYWSAGPGFETGLAWVTKIYKDIARPKFSELRAATGLALWSAYFNPYEDAAKLANFSKEVKDNQQMTLAQKAATQYAARQVMTYLADALFDGKGLPERGGDRRIFTSDGLWTHRFRREWGLFFDPHAARAKGLDNEEEHQRKEKNRGDHRHHAVDAVLIALSSRSMQLKWEERERRADEQGAINTADESALENYRRNNPLPPPHPFKSAEELRDAVQRAVYGDDALIGRPVSHRPVKRKIIGALHEETLLGPILDASGEPTEIFRGRKGILALTPNHLRMPDGWDDLKKTRDDPFLPAPARRAAARQMAALDDPPPAKSGLIRDRDLRDRLRTCVREAGGDPDSFTANDVKKLAEQGRFKHASGVPIRSFILLRTMSEPALMPRRKQDYATGRSQPDPSPASLRAYLGGNNHHIEIRVDAKGRWSGITVSAFEAASRKRAFYRFLKEANVPAAKELRKLPKAQRRRFADLLRAAQQQHAIINRADDPDLGGTFIMSLCEGEMLFMRHKATKELGYFVVAKLNSPQTVVLVPHWDARAAGERKDEQGRKVPDSSRDQFLATPSDLRDLAPPDRTHAVKVRVSPLGHITELTRD